MGFSRTVQCSRRGSMLLLSIVALFVMLVLILALLRLSQMHMLNAAYESDDSEALVVAEAGLNEAVSLLEKQQIPSFPYSTTDQPMGRGHYTWTVEEFPGGRYGAYSVTAYAIRAVGTVGRGRRTLELRGHHDTFLDYSRFVEYGTLRYGTGAYLSGEVYSGGDISLPTVGPVTFDQDVTAVGNILNEASGVYHAGKFENAEPINLAQSVDLNFYRDLAQNSGLYFSSSAAINLSSFEVDGDRSSAGGARVYYDGNLVGRIHEPPEETDFSGVIFVEGDASVEGVLSGLSATIVASDDIIVTNNVGTGTTRERQDRLNPPVTFNSQQGVEQVEEVPLDSLIGTTASEVRLRVAGTKWNRIEMYVKDETGQTLGVSTVERVPGSPDDQSVALSGLALDASEHDYTAELHYWSDGTGANPTWIEVAEGDPVNVGLVATDMVYIGSNTPRVLTVDAAILARNRTWRALGYSSDHPPNHGVWDLDRDGQIETLNEDGWNETAVNSNTWMLTIHGPIVTHSGGSAGSWSAHGSSSHNTRSYDYDDDIVQHQPPAFPVLLDRWATAYWREIMPGPVAGAVSSPVR
ncbi:MAG: hypothetical protein ACE5O2_02660 [Armatimonadota bacterium]